MCHPYCPGSSQALTHGVCPVLQLHSATYTYLLTPTSSPPVTSGCSPDFLQSSPRPSNADHPLQKASSHVIPEADTARSGCGLYSPATGPSCSHDRAPFLQASGDCQTEAAARWRQDGSHCLLLSVVGGLPLLSFPVGCWAAGPETKAVPTSRRPVWVAVPSAPSSTQGPAGRWIQWRGLLPSFMWRRFGLWSQPLSCESEL